MKVKKTTEGNRKKISGKQGKLKIVEGVLPNKAGQVSRSLKFKKNIRSEECA